MKKRSARCSNAAPLEGNAMKKLLLLLPVMLLLVACSTVKPSFVFLEKTAVDQNTGLTWAKNANMPGHQLIWRGDDNVYEYMKRLNETNYAGYADWRVPSKEEMAKLIEYARSMGYDQARMDTWPYQKLRQLGLRRHGAMRSFLPPFRLLLGSPTYDGFLSLPNSTIVI